MKKLAITLAVAFTACTGQIESDQQNSESSDKKEDTTTTLEINNSGKWKADEATKTNVAAMVAIVNDSTYSNVAKRKELSTSLQSSIDTLISQCSMKGAEHDALHAWLEKVLEEMKELKEEDEDEDYDKTYADLKKNIERFYSLFE